MKKIGMFVLACLLSVSLVGCGGNDNNASSSDISGKVTLDGSTSMEKLMKMLEESIRDVHPDLMLETQFTGSSTGIKSLINGNVDIGNSSRGLKDEEKKAGICENVVAIDGIAVIVDKDNGVANLSKQQLIDIYTGKIRNWKDIGGSDQNIVVIGREAGSGTRDGFESILDIKDKCQYANQLNETGAVVAKVMETKGAIGYVSLDIASDSRDSINILNIDGVEANENTILDGTYKLQRPFVMATKGTLQQQAPKVKAVFDYLKSNEGQEIIKKAGLVVPNK